MSRRRRASGPAISLFSFQDIITSVTAILILLVLILTLELISRVSDRGVASEHRQIASQLRASLTRLRKQAEGLRHTVTDNRQESLERAGFSHLETTRRIEAAERDLRESEAEIRKLDGKKQDARAELRAAERDLVDAGEPQGDAIQEQSAAIEERAIEIETSNASEEQRQESQQRKQANPSGAGTLVFNPDPDSTRRPSLIELSADGVVVLPAGKSEARRFGWGLLGPRTAFLNWLDGIDKQRHYVVIILRPSGLPRYDAVREAVRGKGIDLGVELVGEDMQVVFADGRES